MHIEAVNAELLALRAENEALRQGLAAAQEETRQARTELGTLEERLAQALYELEQIKRLVFAAKSERFVPDTTGDQLPLFDGGAVVVEAPAAKETVMFQTVACPERERRKPARQDLPAHLPRETVVIEPDVDRTGLKKIGEEVTETLDYRPARMVVKVRVRPKYVDPANEDRGVIIAELPPRPIEKGIAEPGLLANVVIEKYADHLPVYRQLQRFKREGITLAASTVGGWIAATADLLEPLYDALTKEVLASGYVQADETPIRVQDPAKKGKTHEGYYWVYHAPRDGLVVMDYQRGRGSGGPGRILKTYQGALRTDGYVVYEDFDRREGVITYGCWAHARRYFFEALKSAPDKAPCVLEEIQTLYEIERFLCEADPTPKNRRRVRQERAVPILRRIHTYLENNPGLPKSPWGQAVHYSLARWDKLTRYTDDGQIEIDNNLVENAIRPIALGRRYARYPIMWSGGYRARLAA
ncbi:MAG: IS66 family transposase [Rhodothermales bacterium]